MAKHGKRYRQLRERRSTASTSTRRPRPIAHRQGAQAREVRRDGRGPRAHWASTSATPTSSCAGTIAPAARPRQGASRWPCSPRATRPREAEEAGADFVGAEDLAERIEGGFTDFDVAIATPDMMPVVGRLGPHPRPAGQDAQPQGRHRHRWTSARPSSESKAGKVEYRTDRTGDRPPRRSARRRSTSARLLENYAARHRGARPRQARRREGPLPRARSPWPRRWARASRSTRPAPGTCWRRPRSGGHGRWPRLSLQSDRPDRP